MGVLSTCLMLVDALKDRSPSNFCYFQNRPLRIWSCEICGAVEFGHMTVPHRVFTLSIVIIAAADEPIRGQNIYLMTDTTVQMPTIGENACLQVGVEGICQLNQIPTHCGSSDQPREQQYQQAPSSYSCLST